MKSPLLRSVAAFLTRLAFCFFVVVGAQCIAPRLENQLFSRAQSPSSRATQSTSRKLANPLNDLLDEAQRHIDKSDFEAAIAPLQKVLAEKPEFAYAHFQLAYVYTALKRTEDARSEYERAISLDPKMAEACLNLGILLLDQRPADAIAPLRKAVALLPAQSRPRFLLGVALERSGDKVAAAESFEGALGLDPRDLETLVHLANVYSGLQRASDADAKFRAALEIQPNFTPALIGLAQSLDAQKKPEAAGAYRGYLSVQPNDSAVRARLVHLLLDQQQYDTALAELDLADAGQPPSLDSLRLRADIQVAQEHLDDAIATLRKAIALAPGDARLHGGLGRLFLQKRDFPAVEKELNVALQLDRNNLVYWKDLSSSFYLAGNYQGALAALDVIAKSETPGAGGWFIRALCYDKLNQVQPAFDAYQKFLELAPDKKSDQVWQAQQRTKVLRRILDQKR
jgi:Flp pilus assembly protein TadD